LTNMGCTSSSPKMPRPSKITVYYWGPHGEMNFYGRSIAIYLTLDQAQFPYEKKPPSELPGGFVPLGNSDAKAYAPPAVEIDGTIMGQAPQILTVLGELFGLGGNTTSEKMQVLHALGDVQDIFDIHSKFTTDDALKKKWFGYLEQKLNGRTWLGGTPEPTIADFHGVFAFCWVEGKQIDFSDYPNGTKWWQGIKAYPVVAKMFASCENGRKMVPA